MARNTPPPPPRYTGDPTIDQVSIVQWFSQFYAVAVLEDQEDAGTLTISDANTQAIVQGFVSQSNANYIVTTSATGFTGSPPDAAFTIKSIAKEQSKFTVTLAAAPGVGNSVTFDWHIKR